MNDPHTDDAPTPAQERFLDLIEMRELKGMSDADQVELDALLKGNREFRAVYQTDQALRRLLSGEGGSLPVVATRPPANLLDLARSHDLMNQPTRPPAAPNGPTPVSPITPPAPSRRRKLVRLAVAVAAAAILPVVAWPAYRWIALPHDIRPEYASSSLWSQMSAASSRAELEGVKDAPLDPKFRARFENAEPSTRASTASDGYTRNQLEIEEYIRNLKVGQPVLTLGGKPIALPPGRARVGSDEDKTAYRISADGQGHEVYTCSRQYYAEMVSEVLFTVQRQDIFPGSFLNGADFEKGEIVSLGQFQENAVGRAPVKLTVLGVSLASRLPKAMPSARNIAAEAGLVKLNAPAEDGKPDPYTLTVPTQNAYQERLRELIPTTKLVSNIASMTEITTSTKDLMFQLGASASFAYSDIVKASGSGIVKEEENVEKAMVFQFVRQAAFTVAVDSPAPNAAGWFSPDARPELVKKAMTDKDGKPARPIYVDSVTYGRTALLLAKSTRKSSEVKKAMAAAFEAKYLGFKAEANANLSSEAKETLATASFQVILYGGPATKSGLVSKDNLKVADAMGMMEEWYKAKFEPIEPADALPIAFSVRYLADHRPAGFVGTHPHRTYSATVVKPRYDVVFESYHSGEDSDWFGPFGKGSRVFLMTRTAGRNDVKRTHVKIEKTGDHAPNAPLDGQPGEGTGATFSVEWKFGTKDGDRGGDGWDDDGKWGRSGSIGIDLSQLPPDKIVRVPYDLPHKNRLAMSVRIVPPTKDELPKMPDLLEFGQTPPK